MDEKSKWEQDVYNKLSTYVDNGFLNEYEVNNILRMFGDYKFNIIPASLKHHGSYQGGLMDHSYIVGVKLLDFTSQLKLSWIKKRSPFIVGILHDMCKCIEYVKDKNGDFIYNPDNLTPGHGLVSVMIIDKYFELTEEEKLCIIHHMGAFGDEKMYTKAVQKNSNVLFTHTADMYASQVLNI